MARSNFLARFSNQRKIHESREIRLPHHLDRRQTSVGTVFRTTILISRPDREKSIQSKVSAQIRQKATFQSSSMQEVPSKTWEDLERSTLQSSAPGNAVTASHTAANSTSTFVPARRNAVARRFLV
ncbi:unnamed protein product [Aphanomyces euteiches]|nr:hypothetical protein Ae201684P_019979 [Aphanomyces euteiches]KAH9155189.1 hypothetical protein AeRB84_002824 [Aphanomyces euteiches]